MIAYYFPPDSSSGAFRPLYFGRNLKVLGEKVFILTSREKDFLDEQPKDYDLLNDAGLFDKVFRTRVFRPRESIIGLRDYFVGADRNHKQVFRYSSMYNDNKSLGIFYQKVKDYITDLLAVPDEHIGWLLPAAIKGKEVISNEKIDVIYATGGPWTCFLIGAVLKRITGKPLVIDYRDPWVANPTFNQKNRLARFIGSFAERELVLYADYIIANTPELRKDFIRRYPQIKDDKIVTIPNGFNDYIESKCKIDKTKLTISHAGALYFSRNPICFIQAVLNLINKNKIKKEELCINLIGGVSIEDPGLWALLGNGKIKRLINIIPRVSYHDAIEYQKNSDILLLIQPDFPLQVPRKLYEYLAFLKPILAVTEPESATARLIVGHEFGVVASNNVSEIESAILVLYEKWKNGLLEPLRDNSCDFFLNRELTVHLRDILYRVSTDQKT